MVEILGKGLKRGETMKKYYKNPKCGSAFDNLKDTKEREKFCIDCKWLSYDYLDLEMCLEPTLSKPEKTPMKYTVYIYINPHKQNRNLDCEQYKRKWWKFWVKD
jgi:hypothetical protein